MLADALNFLRAHLDEQLRLALGGSQDDASGDRVVFIDGDKSEPLTLQQNAVTMILLNIEEERLLRGPERPTSGGSRPPPWLRLMLHVLLVARFKRYDEGLRHLSKIIEYLHSQPLLDATAAPSLPRGLDQVVFELRTLDLAQMNEVWSALRITHHPSLLYRVKLVAIPARSVVGAPSIEEPIVGVEVRR